MGNDCDVFVSFFALVLELFQDLFNSSGAILSALDRIREAFFHQIEVVLR